MEKETPTTEEATEESTFWSVLVGYMVFVALCFVVFLLWRGVIKGFLVDDWCSFEITQQHFLSEVIGCADSADGELWGSRLFCEGDTCGNTETIPLPISIP